MMAAWHRIVIDIEGNCRDFEVRSGDQMMN